MFYSQIILAKKGPLGKVWQAAHWGDKKLNRPAIFSTDISETVHTIVHPAVPMALRVSGHLLLGLVRIYTRQVQYLLDDCQRVSIKVKLAYNANTGTTNVNISSSSTGSGHHHLAIDLPATAGAHLNVSRIAELETLPSEFEIPFDIYAADEETDALDWVAAAELDDDDNLVGAGPPTSREPPAATAAPEEEEQWDVFEPFDEEEEEEEAQQPATDESTVSDIEQARAAPKESIVSEPSVRHSENPNASGDNNNLVQQHHSDSDQEFPPDDDDAMPMDDDVPLDEASDRPNHQIRLSHEDEDEAAPGISFGEEDTPASRKTTTKRKSQSPAAPEDKKKPKRRKVQDDVTVLSSEQIRANLADTSDITLPYDASPKFRHQTNEQLLDAHLSILEKIARPSLADEGDLAPELIDLWRSHNGILFGEGWPYPLLLDEDESGGVAEPESARRAAEASSLAESLPEQEEGPPRGEEEEEEGIPFDNSNNDDQLPMQHEDEGFPTDDGPPPLDSPQEAGSDTQSVFSLGATNGLDDSYFDGDDDNMTSSSKWHKNTVKVLTIVRNSLATKGAVRLPDDLFHSNVSRRTAAGTFFELLQLKTLDFIELHQEEPYGPIVISEGPRFGEPPPE